MTKLPIAVSPADESGNSLTVTFTRKDFSDFVFNLLVTPREERHNFIIGFDLLRENLRNIVEKLEQHIQSNHEVLNRSLLIDVILKDGIEITYQSHEQFFNVDDPRSGKVSSITVTFSHVIAFFREGKKSFEKQQTQLSFSAGKLGQVLVAIRSTDITWPNGIFALLEREITELSKQTAGPHAHVLHRSRSSIRDSDYESAILDRIVPNRFWKFRRHVFELTGVLSGLAVAIVVGILLASHSSKVRPALVLSPDASTLVEAPLEQLIQDFGVDGAIEKLERAATLKSAGMPIERKPIASLIASYFSNLPHSIYIFGTIIAIAVFIFSWSAYARRLAFEGRIMIYSSKRQPRATPSVLSSVAPALALGAMASLLATAIWEGLK